MLGAIGSALNFVINLSTFPCCFFGIPANAFKKSDAIATFALLIAAIWSIPPAYYSELHIYQDFSAHLSVNKLSIAHSQTGSQIQVLHPAKKQLHRIF